MILWLFLLTIWGRVAADDAVCSLQKFPRFSSMGLDRGAQRSDLLDLRDVPPFAQDTWDGHFLKLGSKQNVVKAVQGLWATPGVRFRQCPKPPPMPKKILQMQVRSELEDLTKIPTCSHGQVLIGNFVADTYEFACCDAGQQCGGCRVIKDGLCDECAAGYVMQTIPIVNTSKCFMCDDVPNWHDMQGRTCGDLQQLGICSGTWPKEDEDAAFQGVRPSEACCACGGGNIFPTPVHMPLQSKSLYFGQSIDETADPIAEAQEVVPGCALASSGLQLANDGRVSGVVTVKNQTVIKCSTVSIQDPVRGIVTSFDLSLPVFAFSYGEQVMYFKFWGLDDRPSDKTISPQSKDLTKLKDFQLQCDPTCPWLLITNTGKLQWNPTTNESQTGFPEDLTSGVTTLSGMPSCSCQVLAKLGSKSVSTQFLVSQARLWKGAVWEMPKVVARIAADISEVLLLEDLGPGLQWYNRSGHSLQLPVVQNISTGETIIVSESIPPSILDVDCRDDQGKSMTWSRVSGEVILGGEVAFRLDPDTGGVSGTPLLSLSSSQGRAAVTITCKVALGGQIYDKELPVAILNVQVLDDVCWVPREISGSFRWTTLKNISLSACKQECRRRDDCAAVHHNESGTCNIMVSDGDESLVDAPVQVRFNNCSEQDASLNLTVPGAQYLTGEFSVMNMFHDRASYSRPGSNPERQLLLSRRENVEQVPEACAKSTWLLLHTNYSDFEDAESSKAPEFFGDPVACIEPDVVGKAFKNGQEIIELQLLPAELDTPADAVQNGSLSLAMPSCSKPTEDLLFGTVSVPDYYSLHPCECFGETHAHVEPVDAESNAAVPRKADGKFNVGLVPDQRLFSGPYTCEESASLGDLFHIDLERCQRACASKAQCGFYLFGKASERCTLFQRCNYIQDVGLQIENELYGMAPSGNSTYCHIANPERCWEEIKRRSMLSVEPSEIPPCLFHHQADACDALQLLLGKQDGSCTRCRYMEASTSFAESGLRKVPLPESFSPASQISASCNDTSRLFAKIRGGVQWEGPRQNATFTCVSGKWIGELGSWQYMSNFTCQRCVQIGDASLQRLSLVSMPEVYFLQKRTVHVTYPFQTDGCARAGQLTMGNLLRANSSLGLYVKKEDAALDVEITNWGVNYGSYFWLASSSNRLRVSMVTWDFDPPKGTLVDSPGNWCVCDQPVLSVCQCDEPHEGSFVVMQNGLLRGSSDQCVHVGADKKLGLMPCPTTRDEKFLWHFQIGNCYFIFEMVDTAEKLWTATAGDWWERKPLILGNLAFEDKSSDGGQFRMYVEQVGIPNQLCLGAPWDETMRATSDCRSTFLWRGAHLVYFDLGDTSTTYYMQAVGNLLKRARSTTPDDDSYKFNFVSGKIIPFSNSKLCLKLVGQTSVEFSQDCWHGAYGIRWKEDKVVPAEHQWGQWTELGSCEASISVVMQQDSNPNAEAQLLNLTIADLESLSSKEKEAYKYSPGIHVSIQDANKTLFTCLPGHAEGPVVDGKCATSCADNAPVKIEDLFQATSWFKDQAQTVFIEKSCPVLMKPSATVDPSLAKNTVDKGMTMQQLTDILRLAYHTTPFGDPQAAPFNFSAASATFAETVGFLSLQPGGAPWGLRCPQGAVVASEGSTMPYCRFVDAFDEKVFFSFSGSMSCPDGSAVSGWYNLPGIPVTAGKYGGPIAATGVRLFCRSTALLSSCQPPTTPYCQGGGVVASISFDSNQFKLGCCKLQRRLGLTLLFPSQRVVGPPNPGFDEMAAGYYCPTSVDITGAPTYEMTSIPRLGGPGHFDNTLRWNRFKKSWDLICRTWKKNFSLPGEDESPVAANASGANFSVSFIEPLTAAYLTEPTPQMPFPKQQPKQPKLLVFHPDQLDYKEYCDPTYLQNPWAFQAAGSIEEGNPCFHTFTEMPAQLEPAPKTPLLKGITEQVFWQCSERSKRRGYLTDMTRANKAILDKKIEDKQAVMTQITLGLELAAAIVGMIPWGSYAEPGSKGAENAQHEIEMTVIQSFTQQARRDAKAFAKKSLTKKLMDSMKNLLKGTWQNIRKGGFKTLLKKETAVAAQKIGQLATFKKKPKLDRISDAAMDQMSEALIAQTIPDMSGWYGADLASLAEASSKDCLPLQFGLSKVMCDLFCIDDAVRTGTSTVLSHQASEHREVAQVMQSLHAQSLPLVEDGVVWISISEQIVWESILQSFLHAHEKHDTFTMLHLKALEQTEYAVNLAHNFSQCAGADTAVLREAWQNALRAEERSSEALLEAWSATITTSHRLDVAVKDESFFERVARHIDLDTRSAKRQTAHRGHVGHADCSSKNHTAFAQEVYGHAVRTVVAALQPLAMQINIFKVLETYQEQQLQHRKLAYIPAPMTSVSTELKTFLDKLSDPKSPQGWDLVDHALEFVSKQACPGEEFPMEEITLTAEPFQTILLL